MLGALETADRGAAPQALTAVARYHGVDPVTQLVENFFHRTGRVDGLKSINLDHLIEFG